VPLIAAYHRPNTIDDALSLLAGPDRVPLAGGTVVNADRAPSNLEVVDLQSLGLDTTETTDAGLRIGATVTLAALSDSDAAPVALRTIARAEAPSTLRTLATIGGTIASRHADSMLLAALLVHDARVELAGADDRALGDLLADGVPAGSIITAVVIDASGTVARSATGRTPADTPIVSAIARSAATGTRLALTGVAAVPIVVDPTDPVGTLDPPSDFRGTSSYRLELARVLAERALEGLR